jgi:omega-amidase
LISSLCALSLKTTPDYEYNLQMFLAAVEALPKGAIVVAPEVVLTGFDYGNIQKAVVFGLYAQEQLKQKSEERILIFTVIEQKEGKIYNVLKLFYNGQCIHERPKAKLFTLGKEECYFVRGEDDTVQIVEVAGLKIGVLVCFELRFKEFWKKLEGADVIAVSAWWGVQRAEHFRVLTQALAIINQCYVVASDSANKECSGLGGVITPFGEEKRSTEKGVVCMEYRKKEVQKMRRYLDVGIG